MAIPTLSEVREWIDVTEGQFSDAQLTRVLSAETKDQARVCRVPFEAEDYPDALALSLLRRCARAVALRGIPLGIVGGSAEGVAGTSTVSGLDSEIKRYEKPYRRLNAG